MVSKKAKLLVSSFFMPLKTGFQHHQESRSWQLKGAVLPPRVPTRLYELRTGRTFFFLTPHSGVWRFLPFRKGPGQGGGRVREGRIWSLGLAEANYYIGWINNKVLLYSPGNYIQYSVTNHNGKEYEKEYIF